MVSAECLLYKKVFIFNFPGCANDGISCNSEFVLSMLTDFIRWEQKYTAHTDTNYKTKPPSY